VNEICLFLEVVIYLMYTGFGIALTGLLLGIALPDADWPNWIFFTGVALVIVAVFCFAGYGWIQLYQFR